MAAVAQTTNSAAYPIDLATVLRLAGAQNLDVQIARERLKQAEAERSSALEQFLPSLSPGIGFHRRDGMAQSVPAGVVSDTRFDSYSPGVTLAGQVVLGDAIYNSLAAKQLVKASTHALAARMEDSVVAAAQGYFELARAKALASTAEQALQISRDYQEQLHAGVTAGVAFRGDELRVQTQTDHFELVRQQALEQEKTAAAKLDEILHLDPRTELSPREDEIVAVRLLDPNGSIDALVGLALQQRPELKQSRALLAAARDTKNGAVYGPMIPTLGAQVYAGGLGGGPDGGPAHFGGETDYSLALFWKIGPGGLFDSARTDSRKAQLNATQLAEAKLRDTVVTEVVTTFAHVHSTSIQIEIAKRSLVTAGIAWQLTKERKEFGVGMVLENIQAQQSLNQASSDYYNAVTEFNKAQFALNRAVGNQAKAP